MVVLEAGDKLGGNRQQDSHLSASFSVHRSKGWGSGFEMVGKFAESAVVCRVLGTQPLPIGALFSVDHSCDNRGLGHVIDDQKSGGRGQVWREKNICVFWLLVLKRQLLSDLIASLLQCVKPSPGSRI